MKKIARVFPRRTKATPNDELVFIGCQPPMLAMPEIDEVHVSVAFSWDMPTAERLAEEWMAVGVPVKMGGPATGDKCEGEFIPGRYLKHGCVFTSRGCNNHCSFCDAWRREGPLREINIQDGWNILDNNLLQCSDVHVESVFNMLERQPEKPIFTGGLEARELKPWHARRLREIGARRMYFAYDTPDDYEPLIEAGRILREEGHSVKSHTLCCYVLIGWKGDTHEAAEKRLMDTIRAGFMPYAMLYRDKEGVADSRWRRFQREWIRPEIVTTKIREAIQA